MLNRHFTAFIRRFKNMPALIGRSAMRWIVLGIFAGILLGGVEYLLAACLQIFLLFLKPGSGTTVVFTNNLLDTLHLGGAISIAWICGVFCGLGIIRMLLQFFIYSGSGVVKELINRRLRLKSLALLLSDQQRMLLKSAAEINLDFGEYFPKASNYAYYLSLVIPAAMQCAILLAVMFYISRFESLVALLGLLVIGLLTTFLNRKVYGFSERVIDFQKNLLNRVEMITRNWLLIRIYKTNKAEQSKLAHQIEGYTRFSILTGKMVAVTSVLPSCLGSFLLAFILYIAVQNNSSSHANLLTFFYLFLRFIQNLASLTQNLGGMSSYAAQVDAVLPLVLLPWEKDTESTKINSIDHLVATTELAPSIHVDNLSFGYTLGHDTFVNLTHHFRSGEHIGLYGPSGSGKSTLLSLVLGLMEPRLGTVLINNKNAFDYIKTFSHLVSYVGPDPLIFAGTITENLIYGNSRTIKPEELIQVLDQVGLKEVILARNGGLQTEITSLLEGFSTGQKQRLSLARALLRKPKLLILDEATANLDAKTEQDIMVSIQKLKGTTTCLIVSHKKSILDYCTSVINLEQSNGI